jgi:hypothetical protein
VGYDSGGDSHRRRSALAGSERERVHEDRTGHGCRHLDLESGASEEGGGEGRVGEGERFLTPQVSRSPVEKVAVRGGASVRVEGGGREVRTCRERVRKAPSLGIQYSLGIRNTAKIIIRNTHSSIIIRNTGNPNPPLLVEFEDRCQLMILARSSNSIDTSSK